MAKTLLLHSCCAPCSSYVLEHLRGTYHVTVFFFNPNITDVIEYRRRRDEQIRLVGLLGGDIAVSGPRIDFREGDYDPGLFHGGIKGYEDVPEGGERCNRCYEMRLRETARVAAAGGYDRFATTLTVSPRKNAAIINAIGASFPAYLPSDFKKKGGYQRSVALSKEHGLYRQDYCGCGIARGS